MRTHVCKAESSNGRIVFADGAGATVDTYAVAVVWREVLRVRAVIGRLELLSLCRTSPPNDYYHERAGALLGARRAAAAVRVCHTLLWEDWVNRSALQQRADLLVYSEDIGEEFDAIAERWHGIQPPLSDSFPPGFVETTERLRFANNIFELLENLLSGTNRAANGGTDTVALRRRQFQQIKGTLCREYARPELCRGIVANIVGISPAQVGQIVREHTGQTFRQYLSGLRLAHAYELLRTANYSVKAVAGLVGYNYTSYFIHEFRRHFGHTPARSSNVRKEKRVARIGW